MLQTKTILKALPKTLKTVSLNNAGEKLQGKVRDFYIKKTHRIIITTDRQSAFDVVLGTIPYKGAVLNLLAAFWFAKTKKVIPNHVIAIPDPNVTIAKNLTPIPIEMIVRGYMSGVTKTSIWYSYHQGERTIYGITFPEGLKKNDKLPTPVITPTTHGGGKDGHDERLTKKEILAKKLIDSKTYEQMEKAALQLFLFGSKLAEKQGLILVDTKYEFGLDEKGKLYSMDEIHTPDSSRFWIKKTYKTRIAKGLEPENFDKEFLRLWYAEKGYRGDGIPPKMSKELIVKISKRYIAVYEMLTGKTFKAFTYPIEKRIKKNVKKFI
jgi:phosphoribosylaminoimidazole-succinocarboxamide synthase